MITPAYSRRLEVSFNGELLRTITYPNIKYRDRMIEQLKKLYGKKIQDAEILDIVQRAKGENVSRVTL